jgi:glycosyltransferase involved in cell wall biosynthesis
MSRFAFQPLPERPFVSVLMTSYNYDKFVGDAIRSVYAQTYRSMELVIVDDGSTDASPKIIEKVTKDALIPTEFIAKKNGGQASAWNLAFPKLRGELVCLLDSDDSWRPEKVERMVQLARRHPDAGLYQHQMDNGMGKLKQPKLLAHRDILRDWVALGEVDVLKRHDLVAIFLPSSGLMARREVLEKVFPMPERLMTCPDAYLTRSCCIFGPLQSHREVLASWMDHGNNAGKASKYSFERYWLPVVMPAINESFEKHGVPVRFVCPPRRPSLRQWLGGLKKRLTPK